MFALLTQYFEGVSQEQFASDLAEKSHVILLECAGRLVGFSTLLAYETRFENEPVSVIYSGDTIVAPEAWRSPALSRAWIDTVNRLRHDFTRGRYFWLLLTSGFRTYRFLPVFWREFFPNYERPTPPDIRRLADELACERFGDAYDAGTGIVRFARPQRLRPALAAVPSGRLRDPHVAFFHERNPGHAQGDELVCLTELTDANLTPAGRRMVQPAGA
ncbi:MAG TPA: hypothetical protein VMM36_00275 [Opitutaceae bacterium]|nr:hypothetical protein [Opitutaceae bacterium]